MDKFYLSNQIKLTLCVLITCVGYLFFENTPLAVRLSYPLYDQLSLTKMRPAPSDIVIIAIDEESFKELRFWPWPRNYHASIIDSFTTVNVKAIALNILFPESSRNDEALTRSLRANKRVILPILPMTSQLEVNEKITPESMNVFAKDAHIGHSVIKTDQDNILRSVSLWGGFGQTNYPLFSLAVLQVTNPNMAARYVNPKLNTTDGSHEWVNSPPKLIQFVGPSGTIETVSYSNVLAGRVPASFFNNKTVFIGTRASGLGTEYIPPVGHDYRQMSGVEIAANVYDALRGGHITTQISFFHQRLISLLIIIFSCYLISRWSPIISLVVASISVVVQLCLITISFITFNLWLPLTSSMLIVILFGISYSLVVTRFRLKEANRYLESHVAERTQELTLANISLAQEVAEKQRITINLENKELQLRTLLDNLNIGVVMIDTKGMVISANQIIQTMFLIDPDTMVNTSVEAYFRYGAAHGDAQFNVQLIFKQLNAKAPNKEIELLGKRANNSTFPLDLSISRLTQYGELRYVCLIRDISQQKQAELMTQEFVATVSHELRTPLTSIRGSLSLISAVSNLLPEKMRHLLTIALRNSDRLLMLVNDILDVQKIQIGTLDFHLRCVDVVDTVKQSIEVNDSYAKNYQTSFVLRSHVDKIFILGDPDRLVQAMTNLLSNAAKFSPAGSVVDITIEETPDNKVLVKVIDYGSGIPEKFKKHIFQKFAQADDAKHRSQGTGLGLSITKALVERMDGQIGFESKENEGSVFFIIFPSIPEPTTPVSTVAHPNKV